MGIIVYTENWKPEAKVSVKSSVTVKSHYARLETGKNIKIIIPYSKQLLRIWLETWNENI